MREINASELSKILKGHKRWCDTDEEEGEKADLSNANLINAELSGMYLCGANLRGADLEGADLSYADLSSASMIHANLSGANLIDADLSNADLSDTNLWEANLSEANLSEANLRGASLGFANLERVDLSDAFLDDAYLVSAYLVGANLDYASLKGANLHYAILSNAGLRNAYLVGANLSGADLEDADLSGANLEGADLSEVPDLNIEQFSMVQTLYKAKLDPELKKQVRKKYPHLLGERALDEEKLSKPKIITLRSSYKTLSVSEVQSMANVSIREEDEYGFSGHSTINHDYSLKAVSGDVVVVDNATGLMWHQSGSDDVIRYGGDKEWVEDLNSEEGYAGYNDWRLPTVDEAVSLLESSRIDGGLYIDPVFSEEQEVIWTGDKFDGSEAAWSVYFIYGSVSRSYVYYSIYVRPVRSVE